MAYTIISQNNSTTTLSDGVNTITVPSRVNLTSGNFTIVEVNNNMATLEDGDGNVYRDIPCVATLAGEGGGGGSGLPDQTGQSGKFLTTDGTDASWSDKPLVNVDTHTNSLVVGGSNTNGDGNTLFGSGSSSHGGGYNTVLGAKSQGRNSSTIIGCGIQDSSSQNAVVIRSGTTSFASYVSGISNAFTWVKGTTKYELFSSDGTIPTARFTTDPVADGTYYPTLTISSGTPTRSWSTISALQNTATGTNSLTILGTPSTAVRATNIGVGSTVTGANATALGQGASASANSAVAIGISTQANNSSTLALVSGTVSGNHSKGIDTNISGNYSIGITSMVNHYGTMTAKYTVAIGTFNYIDNLDDNSFYVGLGTSNADYKLLSSDGTIPTARLTKVNTTVTLTAADWSSNTQTVSVTGMTTTGVVLVSPDPTDQSAYTSAGIICTAQAADSLTFTCSTTPTGDIDVVVVML